MAITFRFSKCAGFRYYDAVPYADLSDFFYVWLKRSIGPYHSDLFAENLSPKKGEVVQLAERNPQYSYKTREYFEDLMRSAMSFKFDLVLVKVTGLTERLSLQFRSKFVNIFNGTIFANASGDLSGSGGMITTTSTPSRQDQFGMRLVF